MAHNNRSDPAAYVGIENPQALHGFRRTQPEVRHPTGQILADLLHALGDGASPVGRRHLPDGSSQPSLRFRRQQHRDLGVLSYGKAKSQKVHLARVAHSTLLRIDLEPHAAFQELGDRGHDAVPGPGAAHEHVTIVRIPYEPVPPPRQLLVQLVEDDVG